MLLKTTPQKRISVIWSKESSSTRKVIMRVETGEYTHERQLEDVFTSRLLRFLAFFLRRLTVQVKTSRFTSPWVPKHPTLLIRTITSHRDSCMDGAQERIRIRRIETEKERETSPSSYEAKEKTFSPTHRHSASE